MGQAKETVYTITEAVIEDYRQLVSPEFILLGTLRISQSQLYSIPAVMGEADVIKSLHKIPGFTSYGDGRAG